ncbi:zinc-binding dehydrogenase [Fulvivirga sp. M361]|uniref:zinc-binding dehydrogenase n=1 Tax=Fulvivirga sp. M361 TaxID=2594266 RepID=UPI00117B38B6|nr:zinc-binding dehydrogenase [Fulvivirga sp. M361]TRX49459.1 zinc-binding dehydrogenase [Fulvivirga sp. M361]
MKALSLVEKGKIEIVDKPKPTLKTGQVLVKVLAAALNKRDQFIREGKYPGIKVGTTLGSDAVGMVESVGDEVDTSWIGKTVMINPNIKWGDNPEVQSREYSILGQPDDGTFAEYVAVEESRIYEKPGYLNLTEAAAFPLAGLTAYRACFHHGHITADKNVLISGFGGGVAQFAFQFAVAEGARVYVSSSNEEKLKRALDMGAVGSFNYNEEWNKNLWQTRGGFDLVIDSAGGDQINQFIKMMRPAGRIVFYGATNGLPANLDLYRMFWNQITLQGSTMGSDQEYEKMLDFIEDKKIKPLIDSARPFDEIISAFDDMANNSKLGKLVIEL